MEVLNFMETCYAEEQAKNSRPVCFDLISSIFTEVGYIKQEQQQRQNMAKIVKLFEDAVTRQDPQDDGMYCHSGGVDGLYDEYWQGMSRNAWQNLEDKFNCEFSHDELWVEEAFPDCFANHFIATMNTNLGSHPHDDLDGNTGDWFDGRYPIDSIWHKGCELSLPHFWC